MVYSIETIGMRIWKMVVFADFLSGNPCFILTHAGMLMQCHEAKVIVKPKSDVQSPKVKTKRTSADTKITWDTTPPDGITSIVSTIWLPDLPKNKYIVSCIQNIELLFQTIIIIATFAGK